MCAIRESCISGIMCFVYSGQMEHYVWCMGFIKGVSGNYDECEIIISIVILFQVTNKNYMFSFIEKFKKMSHKIGSREHHEFYLIIQIQLYYIVS